MSTIIKNLQKYFGACVFIDVLSLFGVFIEMELGGGIF